VGLVAASVARLAAKTSLCSFGVLATAGFFANASAEFSATG